MENFDIAKYLKEHNLGPYGMLAGYVDLQPLNEGYYQIGQISSKPHKTSDLKALGLTGIESRETGTGKWACLVKKTAENEKILKAHNKPYKEYKD